MKTRLLMFAASAAVSTSIFAAGSTEPPPLPRLADIEAHLESYGGQVTAIQLDESDNKPAHYHVQVRYPGNRLVSFDVDTARRAISTHDATAATASLASLSEVATLVAGQLPGQLTLVEFDGGAGVAPHYDVDVRLPSGIARLKVDAKSKAIDWRQPPIINR